MYTTHKYQVFNDQFHWPKILATANDIGEIYHMDYSENLSQQYKFEPQSSHFKKQQFSLHCTVKHTSNEDSPYHYMYHLSDEMKHDSAFTSVVVYHILEQDDPEIIRLESDNCSTQYKSKYVLKQWHLLAQKSEKVVLVYYGVSCHGKGLVDAMSAFRLKGPLWRAVATSDFSYSTSKDIYDFLINKYHNDEIKHYFLIDKDEITEKRKSKPLLIIKDCMEKHVSVFSWWLCADKGQHMLMQCMHQRWIYKLFTWGWKEIIF